MIKSTKLYFPILIVSILLFGYSLYDYYDHIRERNTSTNVLARIKSDQVKHRLDSIGNSIEFLTNSLSQEVAKKKYTEEELEELIKTKINHSVRNICYIS